MISMKRETLLKTIVAVLALTSATAAWAQTTAYERWCEARNQMAAYKQMTPKAATIKRPWYADWQSLKYTPSANGTGTIFIWDGGLGVRYDYSAVNTTAWDHADNRTRPTGSTTLTLTATGITIKTYNDVQLNTTFDEATGAPRRPSDPYREYFGCSGGTAQRNLMFVVGRTRYDAKASVTCSHSHKVISVSRGGWNRNRTAYHGGRTTNPEGDFITPQKFMHTQTISIPYATLAKAAGMTGKELFQAILDNGLTHLQCQGFVTDTGDSSERGYLLNHINDLLGQMLTIVAAQKCGATEATMKEAFLQHASAATLAGMERRGTATDELRSYGSELLAYSGDYESQLLGAELKLMCLYRYQQLFNDYTALYEHFQQTGKTDLLSRLRASRLKVMEKYDQMLNYPDHIFQQQYAAAKQRFEAARKTDPDASL